MKYIITGAAGFIGMHVCKELLNLGNEVVGVDNINNYYDKTLKYDRINELINLKSFILYETDITDRKAINEIFIKEKANVVIHLAGQGGVRYSIINPEIYIRNNIVGFFNIIDECRLSKIDHFLYASSSSVYGSNTRLPFSESDGADHPISLYAATKKSNELIAHSYSQIYDLPTTGMRFFTVYGPWGRPDMALSSFTKDILSGRQIKIFNNGNMKRSFTYISDVVDAVLELAKSPPSIDINYDTRKPNPGKSRAPYQILNIGTNKSMNLMRYINAIETELNLKADIKMEPMQQGDVQNTEADTTKLQKTIGYYPKICIDKGIKEFVKWYRMYHKV